MIRCLLVVCFLILYSLQVEAGQIFEVKDDANHGVSSGIYFETASNHKGDTDQIGIFVSKEACKANTMIIAKPKSPLYESGKKICSPSSDKLLLKVTWKPIYANLLKNREVFIARGEFAAAALASNEIAARSVDIASTKKDRASTIVFFAKHMKLSGAIRPVSYDPKQKENVATPAMVEAIKTFQTNHGLPASGMIDYKTLSTAAGRDVGTIMYKQIE